MLDVLDQLGVNHGVWKGMRLFPDETVEAAYREIVYRRTEVERLRGALQEIADGQGGSAFAARALQPST